ncbi:MAG: bacillithiol biosynthesis deacetylase BshB1 [Bacteroidota bacterium]
MQLDVLAIGAHPDDVELGCAGTIAKLVQLKYRVGILDLTEGELGTRGSKAIRAKEAKLASKILGIHTRENLHLLDGNIEINQENKIKLIRILRKYRPKILLFPHWHDRHPDHVHANQLSQQAWFYSGLVNFKTEIEGKKQLPWRPHYYFNYMMKYEFIPSFIVDITDVYDIRQKAVRAYKSQFYNPQSKDPETLLSKKSFLEFIDTRAKFYGQMIGVKYGDPLYSVNPFGVNDLFDLKIMQG